MPCSVLRLPSLIVLKSSFPLLHRKAVSSEVICFCYRSYHMAGIFACYRCVIAHYRFFLIHHRFHYSSCLFFLILAVFPFPASIALIRSSVVGPLCLLKLKLSLLKLSQEGF